MVTPLRLVLLSILVLTAASLLAAPALAGPADKARVAAEQERWQDAADAWSEVLDKQPVNREAALGLALAARTGALTDLYIRAEEALQRVLEKKSKDRDVRLALGNLFIAHAKTKFDPTGMKFIYEDAKTQFMKLLEANPGDEDAAVGLARAHYWTAYFSDAIQALDTFLTGGTSTGPALYWKGQIFYVQAQDAMRQAGEVDDSAKSLFRKAMDSYAEATKANPQYFDAWIQHGYAAQYLGEMDVAEKAYEEAMGLDPESLAPLKGIEALYTHRQAEYTSRLEALSKRFPGNRAVHFFLGFRHLIKEDWKQAVKSFETYVKRSKTPQVAWTWLGKAYDGQGESDKAAAAYRKSLRGNPDDAAAAGALEKRIVAGYATPTEWTPKDAKALLQAYRALFDMAPQNPWIRNNAAFLLREAVGRGSVKSAWKGVLDDCIKLYVEASEIAEGQLQGREASIPYAQRYEFAGVISDTGLMFQYYPSRRDLEKAEDHYIRALELTGDGFRDAWENLSKVYQEQGRWEEAYDLCRDCADRMTKADGSPHDDRKHAAALADKLLAEGRVTGD